MSSIVNLLSMSTRRTGEGDSIPFPHHSVLCGIWRLACHAGGGRRGRCGCHVECDSSILDLGSFFNDTSLLVGLGWQLAVCRFLLFQIVPVFSNRALADFHSLPSFLSCDSGSLVVYPLERQPRNFQFLQSLIHCSRNSKTYI